MSEVLTKTNKGELKFKVKNINEAIETLYSLGHHILYGLFAMFTGGLVFFHIFEKKHKLAISFLEHLPFLDYL